MKIPYMTLHDRIRKIVIKPISCSICQENKKLDLCNKSGAYMEDKGDWFYACRSCHRKYDNNKNTDYPFKERHKIYRQNNKEKIRAYKNIYRNKELANSPTTS